MNDILQINNASVSFGPPSNRTDVLKDLQLSVKENEFVAVIGFSGAGKSTLMNLLSGLQQPSSGEVLYKGESIKEPGPDLGMMFQNYSLLPWLSVLDNVKLAIGAVEPKISKSELDEKAHHYVKMVKLDHAFDKKPHELSGGMRQRASLARTLSLDPEVLLLDEPLSALDALTRSELQDQILNIWEKDKRTVVMITNDVDEAVLMADRIVPLTMGPGATLAEEFEVNMARPRDRHTLNDHPEFMRLKSEITKFMMGLNKESKELAADIIPMPKVEPKSFAPPVLSPTFKQNPVSRKGNNNVA
ncbi:ABC transporter ATP-binding protein [Rubritalea marina]|uniref:ABC transporter ATP-binding protein n=1 Tax=Rubritalea marina TaxID=361055 RepID=UPI000360FECA|nr:ABC transporter ATP-binding protein [Rubritalea marina]